MLQDRHYRVAPSTFALFPLACMALLISHPATAKEPSAERQEVGTTVAVRRRLTGSFGKDKRRLRKGARIHRNELLETSRKGRAELRLR